MAIRFRILLLAAVAVAAVTAAPLAAQEPPTPPRPDTTALVFEREVFTYPEYSRRNPFRSLLLTDESGPLFEDLNLLGIVYSDDPSASVALLGVGDPEQAGEPGRKGGFQTYRVRRGNVLGNSRILAIQPTRVIFQVTEFGLSEQRVLELKRPSQGDSR